MENITYPVNFKFNIATLSNDFTATDANGRTLAYVRQKMFKLKEDILIYEDQSREKVNFRIKADRWLDFSAAYKFYDASGNELGKIVRKGWRSLWKAEYQIHDNQNQHTYTIREENGWIKVIDSLLGEVPVLGLLTGYIFNPSYMVTDTTDNSLIRLKKKPSFWGRKFELSKGDEVTVEKKNDPTIMLGLMMMILLERRRG